MIIFLWKGLPAFLSLLSFSTIAMYALMKKLYAAKFAAVFYRVKLNLYIYIYIYIYTYLSNCLCKERTPERLPLQSGGFVTK